MSNIVAEIAAAINRNPKINRVIVSAVELELIRAEFDDMTFVKPQPRPTYGPPFGDIDRLLWDGLQSMKKLAHIQIMGRPVEARR